MQKPVFTETMQIGIVVRGPRCSDSRFVDDYEDRESLWAEVLPM
jgi:hypothetical protein